MKVHIKNTMVRFARRLLTTPSYGIAAWVMVGVLVSTLIGIQRANAAVVTWDNGTANVGGPTDGSGTWSLSSANWWTGPGYQTWNNFNNDTAQFGFSSGHSNAYAVTVDPSGINAAGIIFQDQAYALSGSTLTLATASAVAPVIIVNAAGAKINSSIAGVGGLTKNGTGLLTLGGANSYSGTTSIIGGTLGIDFTQPGAPTTNILLAGGTVSVGTAGSLNVPNSLSVTGVATNQQTFGAFVMQATSGLGSVTANGGTLDLGTISALGRSANGGTNGDLLLVTVKNGGVVTTTNGNDANQGNLIAGRNFGGLAVIDTVTSGTDSYAFALSTAGSGVVGVIAPAATTPLPTTVGATGATVNYSLTTSQTNTETGSQPIGSLNINGSSAGTLTLNAVGNPIRVRAGVILQGNGDFTINSNDGSTLSGATIEDTPFWIMGNRNLTLALAFSNNGTSPVGITKLGPGTLTIASSSVATGPTYLDQGTIVLSATNSALPSGGFWSAPGTLLNSNPGAGQLIKLMGNNAGSSANYSGGVINGTVTISSGSLQIGGNGEVINTSVNGPGTLVLGGGNGLVTLNALPANLGGTFINGSGNAAINTTLSLTGSNILNGEFYTGNNGGAGNVTVSNGTLNVGSWFEIGRLFGSTASNTTTSSFTITGSGTVVNASNNGGSHTEIGWANASGGVTTGILTVVNGGKFDSRNQEIHLGVNYNGGTGQVGTIILGNSSTDTAYINSGNANTFFGEATGSIGNLTVNGGSLTVWDVRSGISGAGNLTLNSGFVQATGWYRLGINAGGTGTYVVNGGVLTNSATSTSGNQNGNLRLNIGENGSGTFTLNNGLVSLTNAQNNGGSGIYVGGGNGGSGFGTLNINGGTLSTAGPIFQIGASTNSSGTLNVNNGRVLSTAGLVLGNATGANGSLFLNGGLLQASSVTSVAGNGFLNFNGGTLQFTGNGGIIGNTGGFLTVTVGTAASVIDTNGKNVQALVPFTSNPANFGTDAGLIKMGAGALVFNASNGQSSYLGPTQVSGGTLMVTGGFNTSSTSSVTVASGAYIAGDGATPGINLVGNSTLSPGYTFVNPLQIGTISPTALTSNGGTLSFKLSNNASSGNDQISVAGNVNLNNVTFYVANLLNGGLQSGAYELLSYGSSTALSNLHLTGLPLSRQTYSLDTTTIPNQVLLDVSASSPANLIWLGTNSTTWDTTTQNWFNTSAGSVDKFYNLDNVSFTDVGAAHGNISIASSFSVGSLNVSLTSAASSYTFNGPGFLTGSVGLVMSGSGSLTINTANKLTGETDIHGGTLSVGAGGSVGDASGVNATYIGGPTSGDNASAAVHSGGTLSGTSLVLGSGIGSTGALTQNGGLVNPANLIVGNSGIGVASISGGTVTVGQTATVGLGGSGTLNLSGTAVMNVQGRLIDGFAGGSGSVNVGGNAVLSVSPTGDNVFSVGDSNDGIGISPASGTLNITGGTVTTNNAELWIGNQVNSSSPQGNGTLLLSGGVLNVGNWLVLGRFGATGLVNMTGGSLTQQSGGNFLVGTGINSQATFNQSGGTVNAGTQLLVPETGDGTTLGTYNLSGSGVLVSNTWLAVGRNGGTGVFNMSGGALTHTATNHITIGAGGPGLFNMTGGVLVDSASSTYVGESSSGTLSIASGVAQLNGVAMGVAATGNGTLQLTGGLLTTTGIYQNNASSTSTVHLAGGTLQAAAGASPNFMSGLTSTYLDTQAIIDTNSQNVVIGQPLLAGSGAAGLSKVGAGTLTLAGSSSYTGPTIVSAGTLQLGLGNVGASSIAHRWSFNQNTLNDSAGTVTAILNGNATLGAGGVTVTGNGSSHVNYVSLGDGSTPILPTTNSPYTIQVWATENALQNWSRIWDFGNAPGTNNLLWSWTSNGTTGPSIISVNGPNFNTVTYAAGTQYNMTLSASPGLGGSGTTYNWYVYNPSGSLAGSGSITTAWDISQMTQANMWLGRSEYGDNDANATYSEVRIFNSSLTSTQIASLSAGGAMAVLGSGAILPTATPVTVAPNATLDLDGFSQQIASLNNAAPGQGGTVINSNVSSPSVLTLGGTGSATFSGSIVGGTLGAISLVMNGTGTQVLSGTNTYLGSTTVSDGRLIIATPQSIPDGNNLIVGNPMAFPAAVVPTQAAVVTSVPEPGTLGLVAAGAVAAAIVNRRRRRLGVSRRGGDGAGPAEPAGKA